MFVEGRFLRSDGIFLFTPCAAEKTAGAAGMVFEYCQRFKGWYKQLP
jgi:hypothetical protein